MREPAHQQDSLSSWSTAVAVVCRLACLPYLKNMTLSAVCSEVWCAVVPLYVLCCAVVSPLPAGSPSSTSSACSLEEPCVHTPKRVPLKGVRYIAAGAAHTLAVTDDSCYSWGHGQYGALGHGEGGQAVVPARHTWAGQGGCVGARCVLKVQLGRFSSGKRHLGRPTTAVAKLPAAAHHDL